MSGTELPGERRLTGCQALPARRAQTISSSSPSKALQASSQEPSASTAPVERDLAPRTREGDALGGLPALAVPEGGAHGEGAVVFPLEPGEAGEPAAIHQEAPGRAAAAPPARGARPAAGRRGRCRAAGTAAGGRSRPARCRPPPSRRRSPRGRRPRRAPAAPPAPRVLPAARSGRRPPRRGASGRSPSRNAWTARPGRRRRRRDGEQEEEPVKTPPEPADGWACARGVSYRSSGTLAGVEKFRLVLKQLLPFTLAIGLCALALGCAPGSRGAGPSRPDRADHHRRPAGRHRRRLRRTCPG